MKNRYFSVTIAIIAILFIGGTTGHTKEIWKFNAASIKGSIYDISATKFKEIVEKKSNGEVEVQLYYWGELGSLDDTFEQVQNGVIQFSFTVPGFAATTIPELDVFQVPFLFPGDLEVIKKATNNKQSDFFRILSQKHENIGLLLLNTVHDGWAHWTSNKPIHSPSDFNGLKWRVMKSPMLVEAMKLFGASPTPLSFGEVYTGLQLKMIDGHDNSILFIHDFKLYEVQDYITFAYEYLYFANTVVNKVFFEKQPKRIQGLIMEALDELTETHWKSYYQLRDDALKGIKKAKPSITINELTQDELQIFENAALPVRDIYLERTGKDGRLILESVLKELRHATN